jgi:hypothetical protein
MKILAVEREIPGISPERFQPLLRAEAESVWALYRGGTVREAHFDADRHAAVLVLECADAKEAGRILSGLPLVREGLIRFEIMPLAPYDGFERLFGS